MNIIDALIAELRRALCGDEEDHGDTGGEDGDEDSEALSRARARRRRAIGCSRCPIRLRPSRG